MFKLKTFTQLPLKRLISTSSNIVLEHLSKRTLIRVAGTDVSSFLQGLITNDIDHLNPGPGSMYAMFLNSSGRILYDTLLYRNIDKDVFFVECDFKVADLLKKHLRLYRVRRKIDITILADEFKIYALFNNSDDKNPNRSTFENLDSAVITGNKLNKSLLFKSHCGLLIYRDPRIADLGSRIIAKSDANIFEQVGDIVNFEKSSEKNYRWLRYSLGVGEGTEDLPPGECFPLECNCDYLHGVSFHKGCYVGQELTARVHHTGVVRKRLMPIYFTKTPTKSPDEKIIHENVNLGKLKGIEKDVGLGLLRFAKALSFKEIKFGDGIGFTCKPTWWPAEAPKQLFNAPA